MHLPFKQDEVESRNFLSFGMPSNVQLESQDDLNNWLESIVYLHDDLIWLLSLEVHLFWNQVIYDQSWLMCLDSFLMHAPRTYDLKNVPDVCKVPLNKISRLFLLAIYRMSLNNEGETLQIPTDVFGEIIYDNYIFDAAKLIDICGIFHVADSDICLLVEETLENVFKSQPKYYADMSQVLVSVIDILSKIDHRLHKNENVDTEEIVTVYGSQVDALFVANCISGREAQDMLLFLYDMMNSLKAFVVAFPKCSFVFFKSDAISKLVTFSEHSLQSLLKLIEINRKKYKYMCSEIEKCFHSFVSIVIQSGFIRRDPETIIDDTDISAEFIHAIDTIGQCPRFLSGYFSLVNVDSVFHEIEQRGLLDNASLDYTKNMLGCRFVENDSSKAMKALKDILPGKSINFIHKCIETYGPKVEIIMGNILEGNITDETEVLPEEKKVLHIPDKDILKDEEHVALLKTTLLLNKVEDENERYDMYDDEYDDTYPHKPQANNDIDDFEESTSHRKFTIPAALRQLGDVSGESDEEQDGEDAELKQISPPTQGYCGRPDGSSQAQAYKGSRGRGSRGGHRGNRGAGQRGGNHSTGGGVTASRGNATIRSRGRGSGRHKQNRRRQGDKKRSQGMMPY